MHQYKITWMFKGKKNSLRADYIAESVLEVLRLLDKSEGVNQATTEFVYIHQIFENGTVAEVFGYDKETGTNFNFGGEDAKTKDNVVNIVDAQLKKAAKGSGAKPHVKLKLTKDEEPVRYFTRAAYGRYKAYEAVENGEESS